MIALIKEYKDMLMVMLLLVIIASGESIVDLICSLLGM